MSFKVMSILCMVLLCQRGVSVYLFKFIECIMGRMNYNINYGLLVIIVCLQSGISCIIVVEDFDDGCVCGSMDKGYREDFCNFVVNLEYYFFKFLKMYKENFEKLNIIGEKKGKITKKM